MIRSLTATIRKRLKEILSIVVYRLETVQTGIINEEWRTISGYLKFQVSNLGNVRDVRTRKFKPPTFSGNGYLAVRLREEGNASARHRIHRLVAEAFIPNPDGKRCVDHINHDKNNNTITNLRWATMKENGNNRLKSSNTTSIYKGVYWERKYSKRRAQLKVDGKRKHLGYYHDEVEAAQQYDRAAIIYFGEYAKTNF